MTGPVEPLERLRRDAVGAPAARMPPSVLWDVVPEDPLPPLDSLARDALVDLRLDQLFDAVLAARSSDPAAARLRAALERPLDRVAAIEYRQAVCRDLERPDVAAPVREFRLGMADVRGRLERARRSYYRHEASRWLLDAAATYCRAVNSLAAGLAAGRPESTGLRRILEFVEAYRTSAAFRALDADVERARSGLSRLRYRLHISGNRIRVGRDRGEPDDGAATLELFDKFRQGEGQEHRFDLRLGSGMNHVEAAVLERVVRLHPDVFAVVDEVLERHSTFVDPVMVRFDAEVAFYLAYLEFVERLRAHGLPFCYPVVSAGDTPLRARSIFDLALAEGVGAAGGRIVTNDVELEGHERIVVVSGPNQGGKTTFARAIGQLHHLAALGLPVPGQAVRCRLVDRIFTHFERREAVETLEGKLERDLRRFRAILEAATPESLVIMNESFSATSTADALSLSRVMLRTMAGRDMLVVCVTFLDELAALGPEVVSMVAGIDPADPTIRTYRVERRPADGRAYALALAAKHGLTYEQVRATLLARRDGHDQPDGHDRGGDNR